MEEMMIRFFIAVVCLVQLCAAQNFTKSIDGSPEDLENYKKNAIPISFDRFKESQPSYRWMRVEWPARSLPADVVLGGIDSPNGCGKIYVGRAWYKGNLLPAKVCGSDGRAFVSYNENEIMLNESEVLCTEHAIWKPIKGNWIPKSSFQIGKTENGQKLYMGRWFIDLRLTPGKVEADSKILQMTYSGRVYYSSEYEILILKSGDDL